MDPLARAAIEGAAVAVLILLPAAVLLRVAKRAAQRVLADRERGADPPPPAPLVAEAATAVVRQLADADGACELCGWFEGDHHVDCELALVLRSLREGARPSRWAPLRRRTPSGRTLFVCRSCEVISPVPSKRCVRHGEPTDCDRWERGEVW